MKPQMEAYFLHWLESVFGSQVSAADWNKLKEAWAKSSPAVKAFLDNPQEFRDEIAKRG